LAKIGEKIVQV